LKRWLEYASKRRRSLRESKNSGYIIVEAAIFLPVFLFATVLLIYMLKMMHFEEIIHFEASENLANMAWESQIVGNTVSSVSYGVRLNNDISKKIDKRIRVTAPVSEKNEVFTANISYPIELSLPFGLYDDVVIGDVIVVRKWSGADNTGEVLGFDAMENTDGDNYVFVFPKYGERYHEGGCFYLTRGSGSKIECVTVGEAMGMGYTKCKVCH